MPPPTPAPLGATAMKLFRGTHVNINAGSRKINSK